MISNEAHGTDGNSSQHNTRREGSVYTVKVGSRSLPLYPLVIVCLGLVNIILLLTAVVIGISCANVREESTPHQTTAETLIMEATQLTIIQSEAIKGHIKSKQELEKALKSTEQLELQWKLNKTLGDHLQEQLEELEVEKAMLLPYTSRLKDSCGRCLPGWLLLNTSCYFYSKIAFIPLKNWEDSRQDCLSRGGDLAVIDTWDEQVNILNHLPRVEMRSGPSKPPGIWFGITDLQLEGTWVWVNNVTLQEGMGYWMPGQPNDTGGQAEDCGAQIILSNQRTWLDENCAMKKEWLCEMEPNRKL